jgi:HPt (histidine-containing phosphotransfer) domain-containing protein
MNDHVAKPVKPAQLFDALVHWIGPARAAAGPFDEAVLRESGIEPGSALHGRLLRMFVERSTHFVASFRDAAGDRAAATRMAHDLKSEAAILGTLPLSAAAAELEAACAQGAPDAEIEAQLVRVQGALSPVLQALGASHIGGSQALEAVAGADAGRFLMRSA